MYTIKRLKWGEIILSNEIKYNDIIIDSNEITDWDWKTTNLHHNPGYTKKQMKKLLKYYNVPLNSQIIMSTGMRNAIQHDDPILNIIFLPSKEAVKYYNEQVNAGNAIILFLHITC